MTNVLWCRNLRLETYRMFYSIYTLIELLGLEEKMSSCEHNDKKLIFSNVAFQQVAPKNMNPRNVNDMIILSNT